MVAGLGTVSGGHGLALSRVRLAIAGVVMVAAAEVVGGWRTGSVALLSDAGHLVTDSATLGLTGYALWRSRQPAGAQHTFGHHRGGILVAAVNGMVLLAVAAGIAVGGAARLRQPVALDAGPVMVIAGVALLVNTGLGWGLGTAGPNLAVRSAALHVMADALADLAVIVGGAAVLLFGWRRADAVASLIIALLVLGSAVRLLRDTVHILNEGTPRDLDTDAVRSRIASMPGIDGVHDLHIWSLDREHRALSAHVIVADRPLAEVTAMIRSLEVALCADFGIEHATVQPECPSCTVEAPLFCDLDVRHQQVHQEPLPRG